MFESFCLQLSALLYLRRAGLKYTRMTNQILQAAFREAEKLIKPRVRGLADDTNFNARRECASFNLHYFISSAFADPALSTSHRVRKPVCASMECSTSTM